MKIANLNEAKDGTMRKIIDVLRKNGLVDDNMSFTQAEKIADEVVEAAKEEVHEHNEEQAEAAGQAVADIQNGENVSKLKKTVFDPRTKNPNLVPVPDDEVWKKLDELLIVNRKNVRLNDPIRTNLLIEGPQGSGKTGIVRTWCQENELVLFQIDAGSMTREDVAGLPYIDRVELVQKFVRAGQLDRLNNDKGIIVFFDEINRAPGEVVSALMKLVEGHEIPDPDAEGGTRVLQFLFAVAAINPPTDKKGNRNSFNIFTKLDPAQEDRWDSAYKVYDPNSMTIVISTHIDRRIEDNEKEINEILNGEGEYDSATDEEKRVLIDELKRQNSAARRIKHLIRVLLNSSQFDPNLGLTMRCLRDVADTGMVSTNGNVQEIIDKFQNRITRSRDIKDEKNISKQCFDMVSRILLSSEMTFPEELKDEYYKAVDRRRTNAAQSKFRDFLRKVRG